MKITLIQVSSLDGTTNQGSNEDHHEWVSKEDQETFYRYLNAATLILMGSSTYLAAKEFMIHKEGVVRYVLTRNPEKYNEEKIPGQLEFTNENPKDLLSRLKGAGFTEGLLVGGATTNTAFLKEKLVTNIIQTIEPILVGQGLGTVVEKMKVNLNLESAERLNEKGTLLLRYSVIY